MSIILPNLNHPFICPLPIPVPVPVLVAGSAFWISCFSLRPLTAPAKANKFCTWEPKHVNFLSHGRAVAKNYEPFSYFTCLYTTTFILLRIVQSSTF